MTQEQEDASIHIAPNGPYLVMGDIPITNSDDRVLHPPSFYRLCRCGGSSTKPFCDGTHMHNGFDGTETADHGSVAGRRAEYRGEGITILDDRSICAHAGICTNNLAAAFKLGAEPWIDPSGAEAEAIKAIIDRCLSGALAYAKSGAQTQAGGENDAITLLKEGPIQVEGSVALSSSDDSPYTIPVRCTLCRCGGSGNKPFCDGSHWGNDFTDS